VEFGKIWYSRTGHRSHYNMAHAHGTAGQATDHTIIWRMSIACWVTKAPDTHSEYEILITFSRQQG